MLNLLVIVALMALPVYAGYRLGPHYQWLGVFVVVMSAITYWVYAADKRRAEEGLWRVSEAKLHLLELLGGWPGAFLAQRRLRHKCSKISYQFVFWLIVLSYQFAAFDSFQNWQISRTALSYADQALHHRR